MKRVTILAMATVWLCMGTTPAPLAGERGILDRISDSAKQGSPTRSAALEVLERVAEGRMDVASPDLEAQVGLKPRQLRVRFFKDGSIRAYAVLKLGEIDAPEALAYLQNLKTTDLEPDTTGGVWPAVQIALRQAQLNRIPDESAKTRFLEDTTTEKTAAAWWAVNELCERGSYKSLGFIREYIRRTYYSLPQDVKEQSEFCEARMGVVSRNPDRVKALGSFLSVSEGVTDSELIGWAISKLEVMKSSRADAELERYAKEIDGLPENSSLKLALESKRAHLRNLFPPRPR